MNKIYIVGMGPGFESMMTKQAIDALEASIYKVAWRKIPDERAFDHSDASGKTKMSPVL